jgi:uncharacterized protein YgiM (DUF1202 family)
MYNTNMLIANLFVRQYLANPGNKRFEKKWQMQKTDCTNNNTKSIILKSWFSISATFQIVRLIS